MLLICASISPESAYNSTLQAKEIVQKWLNWTKIGDF